MLVGGLVGLFVLILGVVGVIFIPSTLLVGWVALTVTALVGIGGLLFLFWLFRQLIRVSLGAAVSPAGDRLGKLIAITFAAMVVTSVPLFLWDAGTRVLLNLFGRNPGYQSLSQLARTNCQLSDRACIVSAMDNAFATLLRYFQSLLADLSLLQLPLIDLLWFIAAAAVAALVIALLRGAINRSNDQAPLDVMRHMIPEGVRRRLPVAILLLAAFYFALSAMFAIPVLRSGVDTGLSSSAVSADLLRPPSEMIDRLNTLDIGVTPIELAGESPTRTDPAAVAREGATPPVPSPGAADRLRIARIYVGTYDRQRDEFRRVLNGAPSRLRQLTSETTALASSSPRPFLGKRDKDRFVAAVVNHYQTTISRYEVGLYNCRNALIEFRDNIEQYRAGREETWLPGRLFNLSSGPSSIDKAASEARQACRSANNPEQILPRLPPDPFELLGPFGATVRWLVTTDSAAIATIVGMIGFGLLGATLSRMIRKSEKEEGQLAGLESFFVVAGGVTAALVVFLGSYALRDTTTEPNPYTIFVTCLVGAVFSEDIWTWARERFMPKKDKAKTPEEREREEEEKEQKGKETKEKEARGENREGNAEVSAGKDRQTAENSIASSREVDTAVGAPKTASAGGGTDNSAPDADPRRVDWTHYVPGSPKT